MTPEEFSAYFREEAPRLRGLARGYLKGDGEAADEAVQKLFVKLVRHYPSIDPGCPDRYVLAALANVIRDIWRGISQQKRQVVALSDEMGAILIDPENDPRRDEEDASIAECEALVREVIGEMTCQQRAALRAWLFCSGDREQAMKQIGSGYDGALNRARGLLRERLGHRRTVVYRLGMEGLAKLLVEEPRPGRESC